MCIRDRSRIEQKYIAPVITAPQIEVIPLFPGNAEEERILKLLAASFRLSSDEFGYEIKLREALTEIWLMLFELSRSMREKKGEHNKSNDKICLLYTSSLVVSLTFLFSVNRQIISKIPDGSDIL